jgi:hypothetical protein
MADIALVAFQRFDDLVVFHRHKASGAAMVS